jgi:membrane protein insertase Oxa1/YidC/SpoIIIJ
MIYALKYFFVYYSSLERSSEEKLNGSCAAIRSYIYNDNNDDYDDGDNMMYMMMVIMVVMIMVVMIII